MTEGPSRARTAHPVYFPGYLAWMSTSPFLTEDAVEALLLPSVFGTEFGLGRDGDPSVRVVSATWCGVGNSVVLTTSLRARYRPVWWPDSVPFSGPRDDAEHLRRLLLTVRLLYRETEMFFSLSGSPWTDSVVDSRFRFREWRRSPDGLWAGYANANDGVPQTDRDWGAAAAARLRLPNGQGSFHMKDLPLEGLSAEDVGLLESCLDEWWRSYPSAEFWTAYPYALASSVMES